MKLRGKGFLRINPHPSFGAKSAHGGSGATPVGVSDHYGRPVHPHPATEMNGCAPHLNASRIEDDQLRDD
jgi:hypothetical protein